MTGTGLAVGCSVSELLKVSESSSLSCRCTLSDWDLGCFSLIEELSGICLLTVFDGGVETRQKAGGPVEFGIWIGAG